MNKKARPGKCDTVVKVGGAWKWCHRDAAEGSSLCWQHKKARKKASKA